MVRHHPGVLLLLLVSSGFAGQNKLEEVIEEATRCIEARDFKAASLAVSRSVRIYPKDIRLWNLLGVSESELGRTALAQGAFERGLKISPDSVSLNENLGFLYYRQDHYAEAKHYLAKAVSLGSKNAGVAFSLAAARIRTGERDQALADLQGLESALSSHPDYWDERGIADLLRDPIAAENSFSRALALAPNDLRALNGSASAAEIQKLDEKALSFLMRAKQAQPNDVGTLVHFGALCLRRDLTIDALAALEYAHKLAPSNNQALYFFAQAQIGMQQWQKAYDLFSEFARRVPSFAATYYALGWLDIKLNRRTEARANLGRCLKLAPNSADPRYELAQLDLEEGRFDSADRLLRSVLEHEPNHTTANIAYGDVLLKRGDLDGARRHFETAIQSDPRSGPAHYKLSTVLFRLNFAQQAEKERALGTQLNSEALKSSKTVLRLASPEGTLLSPVP
jgi:tetratricopeptide (TPR) repeat protein